MIVVWD